MTQFVQDLISADQQLFLWLNGKHTGWADVIMYWFTYKYTWIPLYLLLIFLTAKTERRNSVFIILTVILAVALADQVTSTLMKPYFHRFRPCHEPLLSGLVHEIGGCGGPYGFASSHASTSFAVVTVWVLILVKKLRHIWILFIWAGVYSYSRIYVGVHYPGDILVGAIVGTLCGVLCVKVYNTYLKKS